MATRRTSRATARRRTAARRGRAAHSLYRRPLRCELLEDRRLLAVVTVDTPLDTVNLTDGFTSLREAIFATNLVGGADTIQFAASLDGATILLTQGELQISDDLVIDATALAGGLTIDASASDPTPDENNGDGSRVLNIDDGNPDTSIDVTLSGLVITGGDIRGDYRSGVGGGIRSLENLTTVRCTISDNYSSYGGGLYVESQCATISECTISDNRTRSYGAGGAVIYSDTVVVNGTTVTGNSAEHDGGGLDIRGQSITITDCTISGNSGGPGISLYALAGPTTDAQATITGSTIAGNLGGGVFANTNTTLSHCTIADNFSSRGGGIYVYDSPWSEAKTITVTHCTISDNSARLWGGGMWVEGGRSTTVIADSIISNNTVTAYSSSGEPRGGGLAIDGGNVTISNCVISDNSADAGTFRAPGGGACLGNPRYSDLPLSILTVAISGSTFSGNSGGWGGGMCLAGTSGLITDCVVEINTGVAGSGGIDVTLAEGALTIQRTTVRGNTGTLGGGINATAREYYEGAVAIIDCIITDNTLRSDRSYAWGGGVSADGNVSIVNSTIARNTSLTGGGGINARGNASIAGCTIVDNTAVKNGGGVYLYAGGTITGCTIADNEADGNGGGVYLDDGGTVSDSTIAHNSADVGGGIYGTGFLSQCTLNRNTAGVGGGVYADSDMTVEHSTIASNRATATGGGVFVGAGALELDHTIVGAQNGPGHDVTGAFGASLSARYSLIRYGTGSGLAEAPIGSPDENGNLIGGPVHGAINPLLGPLTDNGGPTLTHALRPGSPALDMGDPTFDPADPDGDPETDDAMPYDQRREPFVRVYGGRIDVGAVEQQPNPLPGDYNFNGTVDAADYAVWRDTLGSTTDLRADGSGNGLVDEDDYDLWKTNFGHTLGGSAAAVLTSPHPNPLPEGEGAPGAIATSADGVGESDFVGNALRGVPGVLSVSTTAERRGARSLKEQRLPAAAADAGGGSGTSPVVVTTELDVVDFTDGLTSLREAIFATNLVGGADTIEFAASLDGATILLTQGELQISDDLVIDATALAGGLTIDASASDPTPDENNGDGSRVFNIDDGNADTAIDVTLSGLVITGGDVGGYYEYGGGVRSAENLTISECSITDNATDREGGGLWVRSTGATVVITESTISGNTADGYGDGGGLFVDSDSVTISDCTVSGNSIAHGNGGGAWIRSNTATITGSTISGNSADGYDRDGGGLFVDSDSVTISDCTVSGNIAAGSGGGLRMASDSVTISDCVISGNSTARGDGGGLRMASDSVTISDCVISGNSAGSSGGGIGADSPWGDVNITVDQCTIADNSAVVGGGMRVRWSQATVIANSVFRDNKATGWQSEWRGGGGLAIDGGTITVSDSVFAGNSAGDGDGGGLSINFATASITRSTFSGNTASSGGGAHLEGSAGLITDSVFENNRCDALGGGIFLDDVQDVTIERATLRHNSAGVGGGVDVHQGAVSIVDCSITDNVATRFLIYHGAGGGVSGGSGMSIFSSTIARNVAESDGGGVLLGGGDIVGCTIVDNTAGRNSGGVSLHGGTITDSTIARNSADAGGGGIFGSGLVRQCTVSDNRAGVGAGIYADSDMSINHTTIAGNEGAAIGLAVFVAAGSTEIDHSIIGVHPGTAYYVSGAFGASLSARYSLIASGLGSGLPEAPVGSPDENGNVIGGSPYYKDRINPMLGPLTDNGGPTMTHALRPGSPALDMGDPAFNPADPDGDPETDDAMPYDQRGEPYTRVFDGRIDIGAFELRPSLSLVGDYNFNGTVDAADYSVWRATLGATSDLRADGSGNGLVDEDDYTVWKTNFGHTWGSGTAAALLTSPHPSPLPEQHYATACTSTFAKGLTIAQSLS